MVISTAVGLIVHKLRIGRDGTHGPDFVLQVPVPGAVLVHEVAEVLVVATCETVLLDAVSFGAGLQSVAEDDVVDHNGMVVHYHLRKAAGIIAITDQYSAVSIIKDGVVGDGHLVGGMPEVNAPAFAAEDQVVPDVATEVSVIDAMSKRTDMIDVSDIVYDIANHIVILPCPILMVDDAAAENAGDGVMANVMDVVADDAHIRGVVDDAIAGTGRVTADIEAFDVDIISQIGPNDVDRTGANHGSPLYVGDKANARCCSAARGGLDRAQVVARSYVHSSSRANCFGGVLDSAPGMAL